MLYFFSLLIGFAIGACLGLVILLVRSNIYNSKNKKCLSDDEKHRIDKIGPTKQQQDHMEELKNQGYVYGVIESMLADGVVLTKDNDVWFFGANGETIHNR